MNYPKSQPSFEAKTVSDLIGILRDQPRDAKVTGSLPTTQGVMVIPQEGGGILIVSNTAPESS